MSYIHCHSCGWNQDDFWSWRYNPLQCFWRFSLKEHARPRYVRAVFVVGPAERRVHSWAMILRDITRYFWRAWQMRWWTRRAWVSAVKAGRGGCPKCDHRLCED
jgi:hypothetical protein